MVGFHREFVAMQVHVEELDGPHNSKTLFFNRSTLHFSGLQLPTRVGDRVFVTIVSGLAQDSPKTTSRGIGLEHECFGGICGSVTVNTGFH